MTYVISCSVCGRVLLQTAGDYAQAMLLSVVGPCCQSREGHAVIAVPTGGVGLGYTPFTPIARTGEPR